MGISRRHFGEDLLSAYADGETTAAETDAIRRHLPTCPDCAELVDRFQGLDAALAGPASLPCEAVLPLLSAELDGELDPDLREVVHRHDLACASCRATRAAWTTADARLRALGTALPSRRVDDAVAAIATRRPPARRAFPLAAGSLAVRVVAAMLVVALGLSGSVLLPRMPEQAVAPGQVVVASMQLAVLDARTNTLYVVDQDGGTVVARDVTTDATIAEVRVGGRPTAIALDERGNSVLVLDASAKTLTQIDTTSHAIVRTDTLAIAGTPTSLSVDPSNSNVVVTSTSATESGKVSVIDASSRRVGAVRSVNVQPSLVTVDASANLAFVLGEDSTIVLDATTYQTVATLPGNGVGATSNGGVTALLTRQGGNSRVYFAGGQTGPIDLPGAPRAIVPGPRGTFAVLVDGPGRGRVILVDSSGIVGTGDVDVNARQLAYDPASSKFVVLGARGEGLGSLNAAAALAERPAPSPSPAASASANPTPSPAPSATPAVTPIPVPTARPTPAAVIPGYEIPAGARPLWPGTLYLDESDTGSIAAFTGSRSTLWFVDSAGRVFALDTRTGGRTAIARLPQDARVSLVSVGGGFLYALDPATQTLYAIDLVTAAVHPHAMPFARSIVAMDLAPDGRLWFASSALGQLLSYDPALARFGFVSRYDARRLSAIYAALPNKVWFAYPRGKDAVVGVYDTRWGVVDERTIDGGGDITALSVDGDGTVWASSASLGLLSVAGDTVTRLGSGPATNLGFAVGSDGSTWALQADARGGELRQLGAAAMPFPAAARGLFVDSYGRVWAADTANHGFYLVITVSAP